ncbi:VOC family protein [Candidatus Micrarchaeota archaeon]|nr:VOC family protein [Candidatus Micrarchaeota archaeon]
MTGLVRWNQQLKKVKINDDKQIERLPGPMEYYQIETMGNENEKGLGGGMTKRENSGQAITNYIDVPSIDDYLAKIEMLGGKIVVPKMSVPGMGYTAVCMDTEKNVFGLWETNKNAK